MASTRPRRSRRGWPASPPNSRRAVARCTSRSSPIDRFDAPPRNPAEPASPGRRGCPLKGGVRATPVGEAGGDCYISPMNAFPFDAVLFDCDGVLVDSEPITNRVLAEMLGELGWALSVEECMRIFTGKAVKDEATLIEARTGFALTP